MSMDTLIADIHFPAQTDAADVATKALAVNLSDLAAMAAKPAWFMLSLSLPEYDESWLRAFSDSMKRNAEKYKVQLIGGDTCRGPLSVTLQITGLVEAGRQVTRDGAQIGDKILVSGTLGNAALGLAQLQQRIELPGRIRDQCLQALNQPVPRLELVDFLDRHASAAIDLSDGLAGDLAHILQRSGVGALIQKDKLPVSEWIVENEAFDFALNGGDDYEICLTLPSQYWPAVVQWNFEHPQCSLTEIGEITNSDYTLMDGSKAIDMSNWQGYRHFE